MYNILAQSGAFLDYGVKAVSSINLNWIGNIIRWLIEGVGIVGVGIIVFTLILKTIVLPLDIYSRIKTKKQALVMEKMRPQMEKLQKQYANDKQLYNQKVMELQKKSGYSVFGACLPMIVSLVIFIIVFNAFSTYSQYANLENYNGMVKVYNQAVSQFVTDSADPDSAGFLIAYDAEGNLIQAGSDVAVNDYKVDFDKFVKYYYINENEGEVMTEREAFDDLFARYVEKKGDPKVSEEYLATEDAKLTLVDFYIEEPAAAAVKDWYEKNNNSFLWVGNLWYPDSMLNKEIPDFSKFRSTLTQASISADYQTSYNRVTAQLSQAKNTYNGYFVLIVLSIGGMLLQQFISMKANKSVNDLGTVDGSGAMTNKMMMVMMPLIYGIFSFFYSAAFSIYMITNTVYSIITTLIINKAMDVWFGRKEREAEISRLSNKSKNKK